MPKPSPIRYRTKNWSSYNASLRKRGSLSIWFDPDMAWHAERCGNRGRPETFSDAAIQTCLTFKVLFGLPLRQTVGLIESLIRMAGLDWPAPDFSTLCRRQARIAVQIPYRASGQPLNLLVDSTGIKFRGDVRAVEFTSSRQGDSPLLPELLAQIPPDELIETVTADGAYDTRRCHGAIIERGADAVIPVRRNGRAWKADCPAAIARNEILRATRRLGRALWKKWAGYHVRSRIEARMNCLKAFSERIMSRDPDRQTAEIQIRIAIMNRYNALGTAEIEAVA